MVPDDRFDAELRRRLRGIEPPPPPPMDWAAMARSAKTGTAPGAASVQGTYSFLRLWGKLLGGVAVLVVVFYIGAHNWKSEQSLDAQVSAVPVKVQHDAQGAHHHVVAPVAPVNDHSSPATPATIDRSVTAVQKEAKTEARPERSQRTSDGTAAASLVSSREREAHEERAGDAIEEHDHHREGGTSGEPPVRTTQEPAEISSIDMPLPVSAAERTDADQAGAVQHTREDLAPLPPTGITVQRDELERLNVRQAAWVAPVGIPATASLDASWGSPFPRYAISPWVSLDHSIYQDEASGSDASVDELGSRSELLGSFGLRFQYAFDRQYAIITGLQYAHKGNLMGTVRSSSAVFTEYALSGNYFKVPLAIRYALPKENKDLYLRAGVLFEFNSRGGSDRVAVHDEERQEVSTLVLGSGSMGVSLDLGLGVQFRIARGVGLFIEPSYQYSFSPVIKYPAFDRLPFNPRVHTFSLATGLSFQFHHR